MISAKEEREKFIAEVQESSKNTFSKAYSGRSRTMAVKAKCLDCCCFTKIEITECSVVTCPLWEYRPYQVKSK